MRYHFGRHTLDVGMFKLICDGDRVPLEPRTFDVLVYLVRHRDRVVTKEELLDEVWGDRFVGESALTTQIKHARFAVGDDARSQHVIRTQHRVGYRFVAEVVEEPASQRAASRSELGHVDSSLGHLPARSQLRVARTSLIGREQDVADLSALVATHPLVTLTGTGGTGKTRLAEEVGRATQQRWADGVRFVDLAAVDDPDDVLDAMAGVLGLLDTSHQTADELLARLQRRVEELEALCIVDNGEHVVDAAAVAIDAVLAVGGSVHCPASTSRTTNPRANVLVEVFRTW